MKPYSAHHRLLAVGASLLAAALACSAPAASQDTPTSPGEVAQDITNTPVSAPPADTAVVPVPTSAPAATATTAPGVTPSATSCLYNSAYVADLTIPDGTEVQVGKAFTKSWRIKNNGCQTWPNGTTLIFVSGNQMSGPANVAVPETAVGGTQDVSVNLKAPSPAGDFQGYWQLRTPSGVQFGDKVFVKIKSTNPTAPTATPGPTATPTPSTGVDFSATFVGSAWSCTSGSETWYMYTAVIHNTGSVALRSGSWTLQSPVGTAVNTGSSNTPFQSVATGLDCGSANLNVSVLAPGASAWASGYKSGSALTSDDDARLAIKLCSADNQGGDCKLVRVNFTVP